MGTCYTYLLYDEWDWYGSTRERKIEAIKKEFPVATVLAHWPHYIVIDMDKNSPLGDNVQRLKVYCDKCFYYGDYDSGTIYELKFKQTPIDHMYEANKPENRNAKYIKEANDAWTEDYNNRTRIRNNTSSDR